MARNADNDPRKRAVRDRSQFHNPATGQWITRDPRTGQFMAATKADGKPFEGIRRESRRIQVSPGIDPAELKDFVKRVKEMEAQRKRLQK